MQPASADYGTVVPQDAVAIIVSRDGRMQLVSPHSDGDTAQMPICQAVLFAIAMKLGDDEWIDELIEELRDEGLAQ